MATPKEISKIFTSIQLSHRKVSRDVQIGDLAILRIKEGPSACNEYRPGVRTYFVQIKDIIPSKHDHLIKYVVDIYEDGVCRRSYIEKGFVVSLYPVVITDDDYTKVKSKYDKKLEIEAKRKAKYEEQLRRDAEYDRKYKEALRKQEEEYQQERLRMEEERHEEPMVITVGMWEDMKKRMSELEKLVDDMERKVMGLSYTCYGPGEDE